MTYEKTLNLYNDHLDYICNKPLMIIISFLLFPFSLYVLITTNALQDYIIYSLLAISTFVNVFIFFATFYLAHRIKNSNEHKALIKDMEEEERFYQREVESKKERIEIQKISVDVISNDDYRDIKTKSILVNDYNREVKWILTDEGYKSFLRTDIELEEYDNRFGNNYCDGEYYDYG